ncbi:MAG TPA: NADP-dependent isocitrate dehydrogenase, partial [Nitriliruptoraceae bacterium]|nr:NADP-dependent isocitrate dehydrogenase [Nitriliruptoraceae bacterium]
MSTIIYTFTDEAPALATTSLLPVIEAFAGVAGVEVETRDISLAARILAQFPDLLGERAVNDALSELGELATTPEANIIKLPNISASLPQLKAAITELQDDGYPLPDYPEEATSEADADVRARYSVAMGSAVNPVLREGNSDRRAPRAVKAYARANPHPMGEWSSDSRTRVATMGHDDFRSTEVSTTVDHDDDVRIQHVASDGTVTVLKESTPLLAGEIIDASVMRRDALVAFLEAQVQAAREAGILFSIHLKATMMKVSDPIIFGHAVRAYFDDVFANHATTLTELGVSANDGMASLEAALDDLPEDRAQAIRDDIAAAYDTGPGLAQVNSDKGITNLHVPSDIIIDASMPAMIRTSGQMWNAAGEAQDALTVIPDSSYAALYDETIRDCQRHGAFDPTTMGTVQNIGLMAKKAEEYGSHDKTFEIESAGVVEVVDQAGAVLLSLEVGAGDIWRMCQTKDDAVQDWIRLAVRRARATGMPIVFWLEDDRAHDAQLLAKLDATLPTLDTDGLDIETLDVAEATRYTLDRVRRGDDTIAVTGNVLRDYLTDLFPILELGTSAKMLSIVPLLNGGGLFETGAGGSAPKHVQQFVAENHLRWDSLGEFLALAVSLDHLAEHADNPRAAILSAALDEATEQLLMTGKSPSRKVNENDNRGSHYWLARYWARALADQDDDAELAAAFADVAEALAANEDAIVAELLDVQGDPVDIGGYYWPDPALVEAAMRPSPTLN